MDNVKCQDIYTKAKSIRLGCVMNPELNDILKIEMLVFLVNKLH